MLCINTYIRNLGKGCRRSYLLGRNRDTDIGNGCVDSVGRRRRDRVALTYAPYQASPVAQWPRPAAKQECVRLLTQSCPTFCQAGDVASIPGWGRSPRGGSGTPLHYSGWENHKDREAWWATVQGAAESDMA